MQPTDSPSVPELIDVWEAELCTPLDLCAGLVDEQWHAPTPCPGWDVADVVAHMGDVDGFLTGQPRPDRQPDWDRLPHVRNDVGRFTETGVDARRGAPPEQLLAELRELAAARRAQLDALPVDAEVLSPFGRPTTLERLIRMRTFDLWAHEQDIRAALGLDGGWDTDGAVVSYQQMTRALLALWPQVGAPERAVVHLRVTGPGISGDTWVVGGADGRSAFCRPVDDPTVEVTMSWPDYAMLSCGRIALESARERITVRGDVDLAERLLAELVITP